MRGDLPEAAMRLMAQLPSRTHERKPWREPPPRDYAKQVKPDAATLAAAERPRKLRVGRAVYDNVAQAARMRKTQIRVINAMLASGQATYLEGSK